MHRIASVVITTSGGTWSREEPSLMTQYLDRVLATFPQLLTADVFAYRDFVRHHPPEALYDEYREEASLVGFDLPKCNERAVKLRQEGNRLYAKRKYQDALKKYNESICWARGDSEDLGIGFSNRSAIYYEMQEYEFCLANIKLAKQSNYPERLLPKLEVRERNCREMIDAGENKCSKPCPKIAMNMEVNPTIPMVAQGITTAKFPRFGRGMQADKDFKVGDVILRERPVVVEREAKDRFVACHQCASENLRSLIPCPHCTSVMFCGEECRQSGWKECHRFECGIYDKLSMVRFGSFATGLKMFFYGLTRFNDSVKDMMEYCAANGPTGNNPFSVDHTKLTPLDAFKLFRTAKVKPVCPQLNSFLRCVAAIFYDIYLKHPLVDRLFVGTKQRNFLLQSLNECMVTAIRMMLDVSDFATFQLFTLASVCNHSCDPNAYASYRSGELKMIVLRPISRGQQICISYGIFRDGTTGNRRRQLATLLDFRCVCDACDLPSVQKQQRDVKRHPQVFHQHLEVVRQILADGDCTAFDKHNAARQFIQRYGYVHPMDEFRWLVADYRQILQAILDDEANFEVRKRALVDGN